MNIGIVYKSQYPHKVTKEMIDTVIMDIRTITVMKTFTISVNSLKFPSGKIGSAIAAGKEDHPDYHILANFSKRGESLSSTIVGNLKNKRSEDGVIYKKGHIFDPFVSPNKIYIALFTVQDDRKQSDTHIFNVVADPYKPIPKSSNDQNAAAVPNYRGEDMGGSNSRSPTTTMTTAVGSTVPVYVNPLLDDINDDEIPF